MSPASLNALEADRAATDDLDTLVEQIVDRFPKLTENHKAQLSRLLTPSP